MVLLHRGPSLCCLWLALLPLGAPPSQLTAQAPSEQEGPLQTNTDLPRAHLVSNDTILRMHKAGLGDDLLIQTIQLQPGHYDTAPDDLITLKSAGLSDRVISAMQAHGTGLSLHTAAAAAIAHPTPTSLGLDEIGVYYKAPPAKDGTHPGDWIELHTERVIFKSAGTIKNILSDGLIGKDMNGHLDGPKSELSLPTGVEILIYAPAGTNAEEYDFLRFETHKDSREFRTLTGGVLHSESGPTRDEVQFHPYKLGPQMYTFTVPVDIEKGEYGILPPGSANIQGIAGTGKIFTFSIRE
jgi:hypothetical protein